MRSLQAPVEFRVEDFSVELTYKRMKNIRLKPTPDGRILASAPFGISPDYVAALIAQHSERFRAQIKRLANRPQRTSAQAQQEACQILRSRLPEIVQAAEAATGIHAEKWQVRYMTSRWGSCTPATKHIRLSAALADYPLECAIYVAIHELCHIKVANHGPKFYALVEAACPEWKSLRAKLRS